MRFYIQPLYQINKSYYFNKKLKINFDFKLEDSGCNKFNYYHNNLLKKKNNFS